ncbi:hypothetical protein BJ166DRAFT_530314 [Pestalotiopsis sp. NC0098]|nr:hypothetical protein BJ166DRAFT_530314 [Pestalotiopsis sp. NC0098]
MIDDEILANVPSHLSNIQQRRDAAPLGLSLGRQHHQALTRKKRSGLCQQSNGSAQGTHEEAGLDGGRDGAVGGSARGGAGGRAGLGSRGGLGRHGGGNGGRAELGGGGGRVGVAASGRVVGAGGVERRVGERRRGGNSRGRGDDGSRAGDDGAAGRAVQRASRVGRVALGQSDVGSDARGRGEVRGGALGRGTHGGSGQNEDGGGVHLEGFVGFLVVLSFIRVCVY